MVVEMEAARLSFGLLVGMVQDSVRRKDGPRNAQTKAVSSLC